MAEASSDQWDWTLVTVSAFDWWEVTGWTSVLLLRPAAPCPCVHEEEMKGWVLSCSFRENDSLQTQISSRSWQGDDYTPEQRNKHHTITLRLVCAQSAIDLIKTKIMSRLHKLLLTIRYSDFTNFLPWKTLISQEKWATNSTGKGSTIEIKSSPIQRQKARY